MDVVLEVVGGGGQGYPCLPRFVPTRLLIHTPYSVLTIITRRLACSCRSGAQMLASQESGFAVRGQREGRLAEVDIYWTREALAMITIVLWPGCGG